MVSAMNDNGHTIANAKPLTMPSTILSNPIAHGLSNSIHQFRINTPDASGHMIKAAMR